jgi:hypothetical protein
VVTDVSRYHYDTYSIPNATGAPQCVDITVDANGCGAGSLGLVSYAYLASFDPANLCTQYAGGYNAQIPLPSSGTYSVTVPAGQTLVIEVEEYIAGVGCQFYDVTMIGCRS